MKWSSPTAPNRFESFFFEPGSATYGTCANAGRGSPKASKTSSCENVFERCSSARTTWVIRISTSSTTLAKL